MADDKLGTCRTMHFVGTYGEFRGWETLYESQTGCINWQPHGDAQSAKTPFGTPLDKGIENAVHVLRDAGIETFESCEGGKGHAFPEPTVRFHGQREEGFRAFAAAKTFGLPVSELRRVWPIIDGEPTGPYWELTFVAGR